MCQGGPHNTQIGALAAQLKQADTQEFKDYITQVKKNASVLADELMKRGYKLITNGTCLLYTSDAADEAGAAEYGDARRRSRERGEQLCAEEHQGCGNFAVDTFVDDFWTRVEVARALRS